MNVSEPQTAASSNRVLILFAHPALEKSRVNRHLVRAVRDLPGVTVHDLYEAYPEHDIDVAREQELLVEHDVVVFQHPFFWYSTPAILKEWQDLVLQHGWAYGSGGTALHGKWLLSAITTGGRETAYCREGYNHFTIRELLAPIEQTARLCGMEYVPPFVVHGTLGMSPQEAAGHAASWRRTVEALRDGRVDVGRAREARRLNLDLEAVITD
jgi:glutathione-regulated potassium-efflux system ancillary protein KefG